MKPVDHAGDNNAQKILSIQKPNQKLSNEDERNFIKVGQHLAQVGEHRLRKTAYDHDIPLASCMDYAGVTDKTRVRKPPGGDTNDIFDLESRQRSQAATEQMNNKVMDMQGLHPTNSGMSNLQDQKNMACFSDTLSTNQSNPDPFTESPLLQMDKENLHLLSNASVEDILKKKALDNEEELKQPAKMYLVRNPITGEVSEMKGSTCSNPDMVVRNPELNRPCVRVRQPPGGVSSNIF